MSEQINLADITFNLHRNHLSHFPCRPFSMFCCDWGKNKAHESFKARGKHPESHFNWFQELCSGQRFREWQRHMQRGRQRCQGNSWCLKSPVCCSCYCSAWRLGWSRLLIRPGSSKDTAGEMLLWNSWLGRHQPAGIQYRKPGPNPTLPWRIVKLASWWTTWNSVGVTVLREDLWGGLVSACTVDIVPRLRMHVGMYCTTRVQLLSSMECLGTVTGWFRGWWLSDSSSSLCILSHLLGEKYKKHPFILPRSNCS